MAIIYKITNKQNGKVYIGQTRTSIEARFNYGQFAHFKRAFVDNYISPFYTALRKYGKDGFTYEVIEEKNDFETKEAMVAWMNEKECYWIEHYKSYLRENGYNLSHGGGGPSGYSKLTGTKKSQEFCDLVSRTTYNAMQRDDVKANHAAGLQKAKEQGKLSHNKGRTYVTKGEVLRFVFPEEAERLIKEEGFIKGNHIVGKTMKHKYATDAQFRKNVSEGTKRGLAKMSNEAKERMYCKGRKGRKGRKWITNGISNKMVKPEKLLHYLATGWVLGRCKKRKEGQ